MRCALVSIVSVLIFLSTLFAAEVAGPTVRLLDGSPAEASAVELPRATQGLVESVTLRFDVAMTAGEGFGVVLLDPVQYPYGLDAPALAEPEEPNLRGAFGIGFDTSNPPPATGRAPTTSASNIYDRPQREISVHYEGVELFNRAADVDFATGQPVLVEAMLRFVAGGAELTVRVGGRAVYQDEFVPGVRAFEPRVALAARGDKAACVLSNVSLTAGRPLAGPFPEPVRIPLFQNAAMSATQREATALADFSLVPPQVARVVATVRVDALASGQIDPWDRRGAVYLTTADKRRFELLRFMTPYSHPYEWSVDVTDFLPLLRDQQTMGLFVDTWQKGFGVSVELDFYPGKPRRTPLAVVNLWQGEPILGDPNLPIADFFDQKTVLAPPGAKSAKLRMLVTGHGQGPNTGNAAEFLQLKRTLTVNGSAQENVLWKTDCYLNPCRPQKGTWAFDRAGWMPGSVVAPWEIDLTDRLAETRELTLTYDLQPYTNDARGQTDPPTHWVESQVIFYAD